MAKDMANVPQKNKMGVMPIPRLLTTMALPMMFSMLVQALYNVVDSIFVSRVSEDALTALGLAFPVQNLMIAISVGLGVGMGALLSRALGAGDRQRANQVGMNGIVMTVAASLLFLVFGLFGTHLYYTMQIDDAAVVAYGTDYLSIVSALAVASFSQVILERLLQSTGRTFYSMITQGTGAIINIILDPIMIFGLIGFPRLEAAGAAWATVIGQAGAALLALWFNLRYNPDVHLNFRAYRPSLQIMGNILAVGLPSIVMNAISSVMTFFMNQILIVFTKTATAVFGAYFKLQSFVFMPVFGLNTAMVPIIAYNYGAGNRRRIVATIRLSVIYAVGIMLVGIAVVQLFPGQLLLLFDASADMLSIGIPALRTISLCFIFAGFCVVASSVYQAMGHSVLSLLVSLIRQLFVLLPAAWLLSKTGRLEAVWLAFPIAECFSVVLCLFFLRRIWRSVLRKLPDGAPVR